MFVKMFPEETVSFISGIQYLERIAFPAINGRTFPEENVSEFMISVLITLRGNWLRFQRDDSSSSQLIPHLKNLPFVSVAGSNDRKSPSALFDPNSKILLQL